MARGGYARRRFSSFIDTPLEDVEDVLDNAELPSDVVEEQDIGGGQRLPPPPRPLDEYGRKYIHLRNGELYPSRAAANICRDIFHKIVLPEAFTRRKLSKAHTDIYWTEFKKHANTESYDENLYRIAFGDKCKERYGDYIYNRRRKNQRTLPRLCGMTTPMRGRHLLILRLPSDHLKIASKAGRLPLAHIAMAVFHLLRQ